MGQYPNMWTKGASRLANTPPPPTPKQETQPQWLWRLDPSTRLTWANQDCRRFFNDHLQQLPNGPQPPPVHKEDLHRMRTILRSLSPVAPVAKGVFRLQMPNGAVRWQRWIAHAAFSDLGRITDYWLMADQPAEAVDPPTPRHGSPHPFEDPSDNHPDGFALFEALPPAGMSPPKFRLLEANPVCEELTGINMEASLGRTLSEILPETEPAWLSILSRIAFNGEHTRLKSYFKSFGKYLEIKAYCPRQGRVALLVSDITACVCVEEALRRSEESFRAIAENAKDGILIARHLERPCMYANARVSQLSGYRIDELLRMSPARMVHAREVHNVRQRLERRLEGQEESECCETALVRKDGTAVYVEVYASKIPWQGRAAVLIMLRDISQQLQIKRQCEEINEQLERWKQEYTVEQCRTAEMMKQKQAEVLRHKLDLKRVNKELIQTNRALSVLARNINLKQRDYVKRVTESIGTKLLPAIDALEKEEISENCRVQLEMIRAYLVNLNPEAVKVRSVIASLSSVELRLAVMIKNGLSSAEIARLLNLSEHTVKTHRRSIRRKLGICNSKFNLSSFLKLRLGKSHILAPTGIDRSETECPLDLHQISA